MADRDIHGKVVLDVEIAGEAAARKRLQEAFAGLNANVSIDISDTAVTSDIAKVLAKSNAAQIKAKTDLDNKIQLLDKRAFQDQAKRLDDLVHLRQAAGLEITKSDNDTNNKIRLESAKTANFQVEQSAAVVAAVDKNNDRLVTDAILKDNAINKTKVESAIKSEATLKAIRARGEDSRLTSAASNAGKRLIIEDTFANRLLVLDQTTASRRAIIDAQLEARLTAQRAAFEQRRALAAARAQAQLQRQTSKPLIQRILIDTRQVTSSLGDFDRTVTRALKTSLTAFGLWSGGVVLALGAAGIAAETFFAQFQQVVTRSAATAASSKISDELARTGTATHTFAVQFAADADLIAKRSQEVALQTIGFDPTEIAAGIQTLVQAGQTLPDALNNIGSAAKFAQINGEDLNKTTEDLAGAMAAAGLSSKDTTKFLDQVQLSSQNAIGGAGDFLESLANRASATARAFGETNQEAQVLIQLLANTGVTGKEAGTQGYIAFRDLNKVIGQSSGQLKAMGVDTSSFGSTIVGIAEAFGKVRKEGGNVFAFGKQLGFTAKSIGTTLQILPTLEKEGVEGFNRRLKQLAQANGIVEQQAKQAVQTVGGQFDQLGDTIKTLGQRFGQAASGPATEFLNLFAGSGSLLDRASARVVHYGDLFGDTITRISAYLQTPDFLKGVQILEDAVKITVQGVADAFRAFASSFSTVEEGQSVFVSFANSIRAFAQLSATVLPVAAELIGRIINFLIDHANAFETFAKITLYVYAARKAFTLLIDPIGTAIVKLLEYNTAIAASALTGEGGAAVKGLTAVARAFGLIEKSAIAATAAIDIETASEIAAAALGPKLGAAKGAELIGASGTSGAGKGIFGTATARTAGVEGRSGQAALGAEGVTRSSAVVAKNNAESFSRLSKSIDATSSSGSRLSKVLGGIGGAAKPLLRIASILIIVPNVIKGFLDGLDDISKRGGSTGRTFDDLAATGHALAKTFQVLKVIFVGTGQLVAALSQSLGRLIAEIIFLPQTVSDAFDKINVSSKIGDGLAKVERGIGSVTEKLSRLPGAGILDGMADSFKAAGDSADAFGEKASKSVNRVTDANVLFGASAGQVAQQNRIIASLADATAAAQDRSAAAIAASASASRLASTGLDVLTDTTGNSIAAAGGLKNAVLGFQPVFASAANTGVNAIGQINTAAVDATAQLFAMQAAVQALAGEQKNFQNSIIDSGLQSQLAQARRGEGNLSVKDALGQIAAQREFERQQRIINAARKGQADANLIADALGTKITGAGNTKTDASKTTKAPTPKQREFVDPDNAIQAQIDRLKPLQKVAEVTKIIDVVQGKSSKALDLTRRQTLLLTDAQPRLTKSLEAQRAAVQRLDDQLSKLQNTQIAGTKAFDDQTFALDQQVKQLQLNRLDLTDAGASDGSQGVIAIDKQIEKLQAASQRIDLQKSLAIDPQQKAVNDATKPVVEDTAANIIAQFQALTKARGEQNAKLTESEALQNKINAAVDAAKSKYDALDKATQASVENFNKAQSAAAKTATAVANVGTQSAGAATSVSHYSTAVNNIPSGKGAVDKSLKDINAQVKVLTPQFRGAGTAVANAFENGIALGYRNTIAPEISRITSAIQTNLEAASVNTELAGKVLMHGLYTGMAEGFDAVGQAKGTPAWFLHVFIPEWIKANKGPVAYDATILVPAGHAIMDGLNTGLKTGFKGVQDFVGAVGPSLSESISATDFSARIAPIMADIAIGKKPDIQSLLGDLGGSFSGDFSAITGGDPRLSFLHRTESLADTIKMGRQLMGLFGLNNLTAKEGHSQFTSSGSTSNHWLGTADDLAIRGLQVPDGHKDALFAALQPFASGPGAILDELIYKHNGYFGGVNSGYGASDHFNHVHLAFKKAAKFAIDSGKLGDYTPPSLIGPPAPGKGKGVVAGQVVNFPNSSKQVDLALEAAALKNRINPLLLGAIAFRESSFNPLAVSPDGGYGLMQLTSTDYIKNADRLGGRFDPFANAEAGAEALNGKIHAAGSVLAGIKAYNGSGSAADAYRERVLSTVADFEKIFGKFGGYREGGGPVSSNKAYVVGEKRAEIFVPDRPGTILPDANALGGGSHYHDHRNFETHMHTAATDAVAVADVWEARMRGKLSGVNFKK